MIAGEYAGEKMFKIYKSLTQLGNRVLEKKANRFATKSNSEPLRLRFFSCTPKTSDEQYLLFPFCFREF